VLSVANNDLHVVLVLFSRRVERGFVKCCYNS